MSRFKRYQLDVQGVPDGVLLMKYITPQQYVDNLAQVVRDVIANDLTVGDTSSSPTSHQGHLMACLMNAVRYCSTKWKGYINKRKEQIQDDIDGTDDEELKDIISRMYMMKAARNNTLLCGMTCFGHCTKAFRNMRELAAHIYSKYGEDWDDQVKLKDENDNALPLTERKLDDQQL